MKPRFFFAAACFAVCAHAGAAACPSLPETMRAARVHEAGGPEKIVIEDVPLPARQAGDVLVKVRFAAVNPVDWKLQQVGRLPLPAIPGGDFSGIVVAVDEDSSFACGDAVIGIADQLAGSGSYAQYVAVGEGDLFNMPEGMSADQAAGLPTVAVAAYRFLIQGTGVAPGERVLVHGGAGGVGSMIVQMAKAAGAYVIATASERNQGFLHSLGVDQAIDYRRSKFEDVVAPVDVVINTVGADLSARSAKILKPGGRIVTLGATTPDEVCNAGFICPPTAAWDVAKGLPYAIALAQSGKLTVNIDQVYPLAAARQAQQHNRDGHTRGKVVIGMETNP